MFRSFFLHALLLWSVEPGAHAEEISICYNYGCASSAEIQMRGAQLSRIHILFAWIDNAEEEREAISQAIGLFQIAAGQQTPTFRDRGRNIPDEGVDGRMDCIDHAHNTSAYLRLMEERDWLQFHRVLEPVLAEVIDLIFAVRQRDGVVKKERLVLLFPHPIERVVGDQFLGVRLAVKFETLVIAKEVFGKITVRVPLAVVAEEMINPTFNGLPVVSNIPKPHFPVHAVAYPALGMRSALVPLNRKYPLYRLMETLRRYIAKTGRQITFEWTLLQGVNDSIEDARELVELAQTVKASVNLIPYNPVSGMKFSAPSDETCDTFCAPAYT